MASKVLFVKQVTNWLALIPHLILMGVLCLTFYQIDKKIFYLLALITYYVIWFASRGIFFPSVIYEGIKFIKEAKFKEAIPPIQKTIDYYTSHAWIDKFRFLLLISSSKFSIRESSICNLGFCYLKLGEIEKAKATYESVLAQYPENINAQNMLDTINILTKANTSYALNQE
jgi:tetratricopeptide (TPR) repeat protein